MLAPSLSKWNRAAITWTVSILRILAQSASGANLGKPADSSKRKRFLSFSKRFLCCFYSAPRTVRRLLLLLLLRQLPIFDFLLRPAKTTPLLRCILHLTGSFQLVLESLRLLRVSLLFETHEGVQRCARFFRMLCSPVQLRQLIIRLTQSLSVILARVGHCRLEAVDRSLSISHLRLRAP